MIGTQPFSVDSWTFNGRNNDFEATFTDSNITAAVADSGLAIMYIQYSDGTWRGTCLIF